MKVTKLSCLAAPHFHLFLHLKKHLASQNFHEDKKVINEATMWLCAQVAVFYDLRTQKFVPRLNKHLDTSGDYVE